MFTTVFVISLKSKLRVRQIHKGVNKAPHNSEKNHYRIWVCSGAEKAKINTVTAWSLLT